MPENEPLPSAQPTNVPARKGGSRGGGRPLSPECLFLLERLNERFSQSDFDDLTGLSQGTFARWKVEKSAALEALVRLCKGGTKEWKGRGKAIQGLELFPEELHLPPETCRAIHDEFKKLIPPWEPRPGGWVLKNLNISLDSPPCDKPIPAGLLNARQKDDEERPFLPALIVPWVRPEGPWHQLTEAWHQEKKIIAVVGGSGLGKTSLLRYFIEHVRAEIADLLWYPFFEREEVEGFFEETMRFLRLAGKLGDFKTVPSRLHLVLAHLRKKNQRRLLFVLDGIERLQDGNGRLTNEHLAHFLDDFAQPGHPSVCLISSQKKLPNWDIVQVEMGLLPTESAVLLLRQVGVKGTDDELLALVENWGRHPLTLRLLGGYLVHCFKGNVKMASRLKLPGKGASPQEKIDNLLSQLKKLSGEEKTFLQILALFRQPAEMSSFPAVFQAKGPRRSHSSLASLPPEALLPGLIEPLVKLGFVLENAKEPGSPARSFAIHDLIRGYFDPYGKGDYPAKLRRVHALIKDHYLRDIADEEALANPTIKNLEPYLAAAYHGCKAGLYDDTWKKVALEKISQGEKFVLTTRLCAYERALAGLRWFFPQEDESKEPAVRAPKDKAMILRGIAVSYQKLGRLKKASIFFHRARKQFLEACDWSTASMVSQNHAIVYAFMGQEAKSRRAAHRALALARTAADRPVLVSARAVHGRLEHLFGNRQAAADFFHGLPQFLADPDRLRPWLFTPPGIWFIEFLLETGDRARAKQFAALVQRLCQNFSIPDDLARVYLLQARMAGDATKARDFLALAEQQIQKTIDRALNFEFELVRARCFPANATGTERTEASKRLEREAAQAHKLGFVLFERNLREVHGSLSRVGVRDGIR